MIPKTFGRFYCGITNNVERREDEHSADYLGYVKAKTVEAAKRFVLAVENRESIALRSYIYGGLCSHYAVELVAVNLTFVEWREFAAVEAVCTKFGSYPHISVGVLANATYEVVRQSVTYIENLHRNGLRCSHHCGAHH